MCLASAIDVGLVVCLKFMKSNRQEICLWKTALNMTQLSMKCRMPTDMLQTTHSEDSLPVDIDEFPYRKSRVFRS